jgi:hypothetical protein
MTLVVSPNQKVSYEGKFNRRQLTSYYDLRLRVEFWDFGPTVPVSIEGKDFIGNRDERSPIKWAERKKQYVV